VLGREPLPEPQARRAQAFADALAAYRTGDVETALQKFEQLGAAWPDDYPVKLQVRRCRARLQGRPDRGDLAP
jgi:hypothetical protein